MTATDAAPEAPQGRVCSYCGLPLGASAYEAHSGRPYCCYGCYLVESILTGREEPGAAQGILARLGVGTFLSMTVMMVSLLFYAESPTALGPTATRVLGWAMLLFSAPAMAILGAPLLAGAWRGLQRGRLSTDALVVMGSLGAFGASLNHLVQGSGHLYFDTATMLLVLVTVGRLLEASAKSNASKLIRGLLALGPRVAHRAGSDGEEDVPPEAIRPGDRVVVRPGEQVPVDGVVISGRSAVTEAAFTGESVPRACGPGSQVYGGSLNADGRLLVEATGTSEAGLLAQMARLVREAQARRAPVERLAERLASFFIPFVWALALGSAAYWGLGAHDVQRAGVSALSVLVVACPCALGLATPLAVSVAVARAARMGVLIRSGEALEALARVQRILMDKTGTLTRGTMSLVSTVVFDERESEGTALAWVATLESGSDHPAARALVTAARERGLGLGEVRALRAVPGEGVEGTVVLGGEERQLAVGTAAFVCRRYPQTSLQAGVATDRGTAIFAAWEGAVRARFDLTDRPRPDAAAAVAGLQAAGIAVAMLSGDREEAARRVADDVGIRDIYAGRSPTGKVEVLEAARGRGEVVAVMGDGINDAPALAAADVGVALAGGTDLARESGDIVLLGDDLTRLPRIVHLARAARRTIAGNLAWAFGYNAVGLALAALGMLDPLAAALLMLASSAFVLGNSLRLLRRNLPG